MKKLITLLLIFISCQLLAQNPLLLKDVVPGNNTGTIQQIVKTSNYTFFNENDGGAATDRSLYRTDGTPAGTVKLNLTYPGYLSSKADKLTLFGDKIIFAGDNIANYGEIWASDGTQAGTVAIERFQPNSNKIPVVEIKSMGSYTYYSVVDKDAGGINHAYLRKTDGTAAGTSLVYDFSAFAGVPQVVFLTPMNGILYFILYDQGGSGTDQIWRSDGTTAGTYMVYDFTTAHPVASFLMVAGNNFYVLTVSTGIGNVLWKSDGTAAGTTQVKTIRTTPGGNNYPPYLAIGSNLVFAGLDGNGKELWATDGTTAGTNMVADINPGASNSNPANFTFLNNYLYFSATSAASGNELWKSDGTASGTVIVKDINPGTVGSNPQQFALSGNTILFNSNNGVTGGELWITDGTNSNTLQATDMNPGAGSAFPNLLTPGNPVYFAANNGVSGFEVFKYDNTDGVTGVRKLYVNDNSTAGDIFTTTVGSNTNLGTRTAPVATISYAVSIAQPGDTIYVDAGVYVEQVTIDKGITLLGAGSGPTIVLKPAVINPPPGFNEPGTFQSAQNIGDVHIRDMSIVGDDNGVVPILLQTGGSIKNCRLIGGSQGIFFRVDPAIKTAVIENNYIRVAYIGINCQGSGLTASLINNTIELTNPFFAAGVFAGLDFGPLVRFTAFGNTIRNYNAQGMLANSYNTNITQNSFTGTGAHAIEQGTNSLGFATCNWFGTTDAGIIASKVSGFFSYTPYLTNGTNTITTYGNYGFLPVAGTCAEGVSNFYVNDNSRTNDVFTTAIGNNSNPGTSVAPFATLSYAISVVPVNSVIHVDAGTFTEQVIIDRGIVINGAGKELTNFVKPATPLVAASPGVFDEIGLIATTQGIGDVHIRNISVNSIDGTSQNIIIQSGGSVKNCKLLNGGQGVFFRIASGSRNAEVSFNTIQPIGIGINCQGAGLSANIVNNTISNPAGYYSGIFAGLDFGPLPQITVTNNSISDYFGIGILANAAILPATGLTNSNITNNSIVGTPSSVAIQGNALNATCNWYGTNTPAINGPVIYSPFLTNGADNDIVNLGFQPVPGSCTGRQNKFYVNDNSNTGNVFTTAVGNDNNNGAPSTPLASINTAIARAEAGDIIFVDAGSYVENIIISKPLTLIGAKYGQQPGTSLSRGAETIIYPAVNNVFLTGCIIKAAANDITIDGFLLDGDNPNITGGNNINGVDANSGNGIFNDNEIINNLRVVNNIVKNTAGYGIAQFKALGNTTLPAESGALFKNNRVHNIGGRGIVLAYNALGQIEDNNISQVNVSGIWIAQQNISNSAGILIRITGNTISAAVLGIQLSAMQGANPYIEVQNNDITITGATGNGLSAIGFSPGALFSNNKVMGGLFGAFTNSSSSSTINFTNNSFTGYTSKSIEKQSSTINVVATCNWYGSAAAQNIVNSIGLTKAEYMPWLTNGTDNSPAVGFQPEAGSCDGYAPVIILDSYINVNCNGNNSGSINITTSFGKAPFTYTWTKDGDPGFISNSEDLSNQSPGTYHLAVTDANGSTIYYTSTEAEVPGTIDVTITEPTLLTASANGTNVNCFNGTNGTASVTAGGGTAPYTFLWSNSETTNEITNLAAGTYSVTVTDDNGCTATASYEVTQPTLLTASIANNSTACSNNAMVTAGGGTAPYSYLWSNGSTSSSITGVIAGIYSVMVTDANGCSTTASVTLTVSGAFNPTASATDVTCFGANNGLITVTNANGTAPFTFSIDGINFLPGAFPYSFTNLAPGTYTVAARDVNGCTGFVTRTVLQPAQLVVTLTTVQSTCFGLNTGSVSVTAAGGTGALSYSWTGDGGFTSSQKNISGLATGNYSLTVTDKNGCTAILNVYVPSLTQITVNSTVNNIACKGEINGSIILNVAGGTGNFSYLWNTGATTSSISNLSTGNYNVTVTDIGSGCVASKSFTITQPSNVVALSTSKTNATGCVSLGTITATGSGGTSPYQYSLDGINYQSSGSFTGLYAGSFTVRVKDANGCNKTSAAISINDNGLDEYDGSGSNKNNTKSKAAPIPVGVTIAGRIATTGDPEDWYKFTVTTAGNYTLSLTHPSATFTYNLFILNNATALPTVSPVGVTPKVYSLTAGDYYIQVTGGLSYVCYSLNVSSDIAARNSTTTGIVNKAPVVITSATLKARTYPNPHSGSFTLNIESPEDGNANVELFTITGQKLVERTVLLQKGENNQVPFKGISKGTVLYRVQIGKHVATGKVIGIE